MLGNRSFPRWVREADQNLSINHSTSVPLFSHNNLASSGFFAPPFKDTVFTQQLGEFGLLRASLQRHPGQTALNNDGLAGNRRYDNQNDHQTSAKCGVVLCDVMCCAVYCGVCCVWLCIVVVLLLYYMVCAECV